MNLRTGANVANLSLDQDVRIDFLERFDRLFGLTHVFLEWQRGKVEDDGIKPGLGCFDSLRQGVGMIRVKEDREIEFFPQTLYKSRNLTDSYKLALAFGHTNQDRDLQFLRRAEYSLQPNQIGDIKMPD